MLLLCRYVEGHKPSCVLLRTLNVFPPGCRMVYSKCFYVTRNRSLDVLKCCFFSRNHLSLESIIFFQYLYHGIQEQYWSVWFNIKLIFSPFGYGMIMECFRFCGMSPNDHILLNTWMIKFKADKRRLCINVYSISFISRAILVYFDKILLISTNWIGELSFVCSSKWGLILDI